MYTVPVYNTLYDTHCTCIQYTVWCKLYLYTIHCMLHTVVVYNTLYDVHCTCIQYTVWCTLYLYTIHCMMYTVAVHSTMYDIHVTVHSTLYAVHCNYTQYTARLGSIRMFSRAGLGMSHHRCHRTTLNITFYIVLSSIFYFSAQGCKFKLCNVHCCTALKYTLHCLLYFIFSHNYQPDCRVIFQWEHGPAAGLNTFTWVILWIVQLWYWWWR